MKLKIKVIDAEKAKEVASVETQDADIGIKALSELINSYMPMKPPAKTEEKILWEGSIDGFQFRVVRLTIGINSLEVQYKMLSDWVTSDFISNPEDNQIFTAILTDLISLVNGLSDKYEERCDKVTELEAKLAEICKPTAKNSPPRLASLTPTKKTKKKK